MSSRASKTQLGSLPKTPLANARLDAELGRPTASKPREMMHVALKPAFSKKGANVGIRPKRPAVWFVFSREAP